MGTGFQEPLRQCGAAQSGIQQAGHDAEFGGPGGTASQVAGTGQHAGRIAGVSPIRKIGRENRISKSAIFISKPGKNVRSQLAGIQRKMYKIVPAERQGCPKGMITKNRCKPSKRLTAVIFGTPGWVRTSGLSLRSTAYHFVNCSYHIFPCCFFANSAAWRQVNLHKFP